MLPQKLTERLRRRCGPAQGLAQRGWQQWSGVPPRRLAVQEVVKQKVMASLRCLIGLFGLVLAWCARSSQAALRARPGLASWFFG